MKTCKKCKVQKDLSLFSKMAKSKDGLQAQCKACDAEYKKGNREANAARNAEWYKDNRVAHAARMVEYYKANRAAIAAKSAEYNKANRAAVAAKNAEWYKDNREAIAAKNAEWQQENSDKCRAISAKRRAAKLQRTPAWVDFEAIEAVYTEAKRLESFDGIPRHVDHIIPLQGTTVSGFHVANNLQILTAQENLSKSNRFELTN